MALKLEVSQNLDILSQFGWKKLLEASVLLAHANVEESELVTGSVRAPDWAGAKHRTLSGPLGV